MPCALRFALYEAACKLVAIPRPCPGILPLLIGNESIGSRVHHPTILSDFALISSEGSDVPHFDGTDGELGVENLIVLGKVLDDGHIVPRSALQCLVAADDALAPSQVLVVVVVELVRGFDVQVLHREWVAVGGTRLGQFGLEVRVAVGVVQEELNDSASDSADGVTPWKMYMHHNARIFVKIIQLTVH